MRTVSFTQEGVRLVPAAPRRKGGLCRGRRRAAQGLVVAPQHSVALGPVPKLQPGSLGGRQLPQDQRKLSTIATVARMLSALSARSIVRLRGSPGNTGPLT